MPQAAAQGYPPAVDNPVDGRVEDRPCAVDHTRAPARMGGVNRPPADETDGYDGRPGRGTAPDRVPARAQPGRDLQGQGVPGRGGDRAAAGRRGRRTGAPGHPARAPRHRRLDRRGHRGRGRGTDARAAGQARARGRRPARRGAARRSGRGCAATCTRTATGPTGDRRSRRWRSPRSSWVTTTSCSPTTRPGSRWPTGSPRPRLRASSRSSRPSTSTSAGRASGCSRASRSTSSTTASSTRPRRCSARLDVRVASVHSKLAMDKAPMTQRMVRGGRATRSPTCSATAPAGWSPATGARAAQSEFDADEVFGACVETDTAVEINSRPERRDPPDRAAAAGDRPGLPVLDRQRRPRAGAARLPGLRLRARRGARPRPGPDRQHLAARAAAGVGTPLSGARRPGRDLPRRCRWAGLFSSHAVRRVRGGAAPEVEVRRSRRRKRTVSAYRRDGKVIVMIPDRFTRAEEAEWVTTMLQRLDKSERRRRRTDEQLMRRARELCRDYLHDKVRPTSVRWVDNMTTRWASCTTSTGEIRLSDRLQTAAGLGGRLRAAPRAGPPDRARATASGSGTGSTATRAPSARRATSRASPTRSRWTSRPATRGPAADVD